MLSVPFLAIALREFVSIGCPSCRQIVTGGGVPTLRHGNSKFSFHGVIIRRLNETMRAGTLLLGGTVTTFVFSPSPDLVEAVNQN